MRRGGRRGAPAGRRAGWLRLALAAGALATLALFVLAAVERPSTETAARPAASSPKPPGGGDGRAEREGPPPEGSCDHLLVLVDREHALPPSYAPRDLVPLRAYGVPALDPNLLLRREAARSLALLVRAAAAEGHELAVASAYRSHKEQRAAHARWASYYGDENAGGLSALPGHSQHQLGTAVDFTNAEAGYEVWQGFGRTEASRWLERNAPRYGFVLAYPLGGQEKTGYAWEPWHYRYIGKEAARRMQRSGLDLQEFLLREGVRPGCGRGGG
ncbi:peptidase M15B and M15C, D,D-carboxypeptidase VanY/endolysins [Rubrobacter xylanophilus DSM 9941]|uniref:Peptidase M15B and M15C, D,D-carboxypeptidase VanY/endolysins n=1 Tax=Rubrobacter xylanophilus (strain DSM 9941 / JCM 11954 / NBRC 16129 / PRD-1) TaxID=266117 RepID=Q1ARU8_RUBXD|nr:M15 family metallopeptidase [Rubrobacter xylanophilus]ABG05880.1 peptidase M15B and M15C, D,D-carboxypeptidase VanY/endolysins [Rubrobacter xylanophilus DSM 9941]